MAILLNLVKKDECDDAGTFSSIAKQWMPFHNPIGSIVNTIYRAKHTNQPVAAYRKTRPHNEDHV